MGQIFNRIKNIIKTNYGFNGKSTDNDFFNEDDELKRIIEELAYDYHNKSSDDKYSNYEQTTNKDKLTVSFEVLGIAKTEDFEIVKKAYKKQIAIFHPDRTERLNSDDKRKHLQKAQEINAAYSYLKQYFGK
jgi:hypothetical protein